MPLTVLIAAAMVASAVPMLVWAVASARTAPDGVARGNLRRGLENASLRELMLQRSATERAVTPAVHALARLARRLSPVGMVERIERRVVLAGSPRAWPAERVLAAKVWLTVMALITAVLLLAAVPGPRTVLLLLLLPAIAFLGPDVLLLGKANERQATIKRTLPDALDQMTVCVEAGLGFEGAMARVARSADGPINQEMRATLQEMRVGSTRADALRRMADRNDVPELRRFVLALVQAESYGLPIGNILRTQARQVRIGRRQAAEEHAAKIPVKLVFPLVLCILPSLFIVILGPAAIRLMEFFGGS